MQKAREQGLAGATVLRGMLGFGAHSRLHTFRIERLSEGLSIIVEGLATLEKAYVHFYRPGKREVT